MRSWRGLREHLARLARLDDDAAVHEHDLVARPRARSRSRASRRSSSCRPSRASRITPSTSPTSSGSSAEVGSSNSISFGLHRQGARDRDALLLAAGELRRDRRRLVGEADAREQLLAPVRARVDRGILLHAHRRLDHVLERRHVREQVEALEHHPDLGALARDLALAQLVELVALLPVADELAVDPQPAGVDLLQMVDAAQERRLPGARRAEQADDRRPAAPRATTRCSTSSRPKRLCTPSALTIGSLIGAAPGA